MAKELIVGLLLGVVLFSSLSVIAWALIEIGKSQRKGVKKEHGK